MLTLWITSHERGKKTTGYETQFRKILGVPGFRPSGLPGFRPSALPRTLEIPAWHVQTFYVSNRITGRKLGREIVMVKHHNKLYLVSFLALVYSVSSKYSRIKQYFGFECNKLVQGLHLELHFQEMRAPSDVNSRFLAAYPKTSSKKAASLMVEETGIHGPKRDCNYLLNH